MIWMSNSHAQIDFLVVLLSVRGFQEAVEGVHSRNTLRERREKEGQAGGHGAKAMCSTVQTVAVLCHDSPSCHVLGDGDSVAVDCVP